MKTFYQELKELRFTDRSGRAVEIFNEGLSGGILIRYKDTEEKYLEKTVYLKGVQCIVEERRMGGFSVYPASGEFEFKLNFKFFMMLSFLGLISLGMLPIIFMLIVRRKYPKSIDLNGITLRNGERIGWESLSRVEQATMTLWVYNASKGALELYFRNISGGREQYLVIPESFISNHLVALTLLDHVFSQKRLVVKEKKGTLFYYRKRY